MLADVSTPEPEPARDLAVDPSFDPGRSRLRGELMALLEVCGLTGLAFTRPVLDSFGRAPEAFLARGAVQRDVVLFAVAVAVVPALVIAAVAAATRVTGARPRRWVHLAVIGLLGGVATWRFASDVVSWTPLPLVLAAMAGGALLVVVRHRARSTATYLRFLGVASVIFLLQFLLVSPTATLVTGGSGPAPDAEAAAAVRAGTGGDPPPIVMVVLDAIPTTSLLDGAGRIDAELYPNLAGLADGATWYRNHTTTTAWTYQALPAMLTGELPQVNSPLPDVTSYPRNLFTLFGGTHDIEAVEQLTRMCPVEECAPRQNGVVSALLGDAVDWWRGGLETQSAERGQILPGALEPDRGTDFARWIDEQDFSAGGDPGLWFYHLIMPHEPWDLLDDVTRYDPVQDEPFGLFLHAFWGAVGGDVAEQRQVLQTQAVDRMLGDLFDELRAAGTYDETMVVVVGDHGQAYTDMRPLRGMAAEQYEQVAWTPLIVKAPGQTEGGVDDSNVWNVDLVPTIADMLGIDLPWDVDGIAAGSAAGARADDDKQVLQGDFHELEPVGDSPFIPLDAREGFARVLAADPVPGSGEHAVWQRTEHGALVGRDIADLDVELDGVGTLTIDRLDRMEDQGDDLPMLEVVGYSTLRPGEVVALTVNGVVAAVAPVAVGGSGDDLLVHALLLPDPFVADNDVNAYVVEGEPGVETLHLLTVVGS